MTVCKVGFVDLNVNGLDVNGEREAIGSQPKLVLRSMPGTEATLSGGGLCMLETGVSGGVDLGGRRWCF